MVDKFYPSLQKDHDGSFYLVYLSSNLTDKNGDLFLVKMTNQWNVVWQ